MTFVIWKPPSLSELTPMLINMGLTHLGSKASIYPSGKKNLLMGVTITLQINLSIQNIVCKNIAFLLQFDSIKSFTIGNSSKNVFFL